MFPAIRVGCRAWLVGFVCLVMALFALDAPARAQLSETQIETLTTQAKESGATIVVIQPDSEKVAEESADLLDTIKLKLAFEGILREADHLPERLMATVERAGNGSAQWLLPTILFGAVFIAIGMGIERLFSRWARNHFMYLFNPVPKDRAERIGYLILRFLIRSSGAIAAAVVAYVLSLAVARGHPAPFATQSTAIWTVMGIRLVLAGFHNLLAPDAPSHRMLTFSDQAAGRLYRGAVWVFTTAGISIGICVWMFRLQLDHDAHRLMLVLSVLYTAIVVTWLALANHSAITAALRGGAEGATMSLFGRLLTANWHLIFLVYAVIACFVSIARILLNAPSAFGLIGMPILILGAALGVYGFGLILIDRYFERHPPVETIVPEPEAGETTGASEAMDMSAEATDVPEFEPLEVADEAAPEDIAAPRNAYHTLAEHALAIIVTLVAGFLVADLWGLSDTQVGGIITDFIEVGLILFLAYMVWRAVDVAIRLQQAEEDASAAGDGAEAEDGMGMGVSRIATLLPLIRMALMITIVTMTVMVALSELGVDIGPLLAGAGVIGLAIGFGAQTLVRDIISGAFFLADDAFRRGEYIDVGAVKGTVEKISLRSMQLRHHNGPLNTIPFGEIQQLTNFSRDWVTMKLPLRVTYDTDVEFVRKLIKRIGQELLKDPEIGPLFLEPLKSQGVIQMEDSAIIIRVKFKTRPGKQFVVRKTVYNRIQDAFMEHGIKFAHKEVTVRVAESPRPLSEPEKGAVAGAAVRSTETEQPAGKQPSAADSL